MTGHHPHIVCPYNQYTPQRPFSYLSPHLISPPPFVSIRLITSPPRRALPYWTSQLPSNSTLICFIPKMHVCMCVLNLLDTPLRWPDNSEPTMIHLPPPSVFFQHSKPLYSPRLPSANTAHVYIYMQAEIFVCILVCAHVHSPLSNSTSV